MLVVDASVAVAATLAADGFEEFGGERLVAPALLWSEALSVLHELLGRRELERDDAEGARTRLARAPVERVEPARLAEEAWALASRLGWAKTYDAEYVALASLLGCRLVTLDARLRRATDRLGFVIGPTELG